MSEKLSVFSKKQPSFYPVLCTFEEKVAMRADFERPLRRKFAVVGAPLAHSNLNPNRSLDQNRTTCD